MPRSTAMIELGSSSISLLSNRKETLGDSHFRWQSIHKFIYFACTFSSTAYNFDIFSKVCENVRVLDFILCEATIGVAYMCMDSFIKQYTRRYDCNKYLNPLLRGISYGRFLQTSIFVIFHASYVADSLRFLVISGQEVPPWSVCRSTSNNSNCIAAKDLMVFCTRNKTTPFAKTSAYINYMESFSVLDRNTLTTRFFILGLVWLLVFFFASLTEETMVKVFKVVFMCKSLSTVITLSFLFIFTSNTVGTEALSQIVDISSGRDLMLSFKHVTYTYGIGFLGLYDFGAMSAFTMIDTATVIFLAIFTALAFARSWIIKILYLVMTRCVDVERHYSTHVLFYGILPLTTEFLYAHKLYALYFYGNLLIGMLVYMTNLIYILSKFLSYEFYTVKQIYIVGLLCSIGFAFSSLILVLKVEVNRSTSLTAGMDIMTSYLGGAYVAIVMWLYGLKKFCTDIQFWLGFKPTRFWTISWALLPAALFCFTIRSIYDIVQWDNTIEKYFAVGWAAFVFIIVAIMNIKCMAGFLMKNNLAGLWRSHKNHGPPEAEDRKLRLYYCDFTRKRKCSHNCLIIDEWFQCDHEASSLVSRISLSSSNSESSMTNLYDAKSTNRLRIVSLNTDHNTPPPHPPS